MKTTASCFALEVPDGQGWKFRNVFFKPEGMESIFNGENLDGWKTYPEMDGKFTVNAAEKRIEAKNGLGMLETVGAYGDFVFQGAVSLQPNVNSGFFFRCIPGEKMNGYECQVHFGFLDGDRTKPQDCGTGGIFRRVDARKVIGNDKEWVNVYINAVGNHFAVWVNGEQVSDWTDTRKPDPNPRRGLRLDPGTIQLQGHDATSNFKFRNIVIEEIPVRERITPPPIIQLKTFKKP